MTVLSFGAAAAAGAADAAAGFLSLLTQDAVLYLWILLSFVAVAVVFFLPREQESWQSFPRDLQMGKKSRAS